MKLTDKPTTTTQPTNFFVNVAGSILQLTWFGFTGLLSGLYAALVHTHDASAITSGVLDPARIPVLFSGVHVASSGDLTALTSDQQAAIVNGAIVTTTGGKRWVYTGSGSKTDSGSYIELGDTVTEWLAIADKPDSFAPSAHTSTHQAAGSDPIALDTLAQPTDNTALDASTTYHGLLSKLDKIKLNTVSANADPTGSTIHAAAAKSTPADTDELPLLDGGSSWALSKFTWANIKVALKSYFDGIYAAIGSSGGSTILRAIGTLQAYTTPSVDAAAPPNLSLAFSPVSAGTCDVWLTWNATTWLITFSPGATNGGDFAIDSNAFITGNDYASAFWGVIASNPGQFTNASLVSNDGAGSIVILNNATGSSQVLEASTDNAVVVNISGGGTGIDGSSLGGGAQEVILGNAVAGKKVKMIIGVSDGGVTDSSQIAFFLRSPSNVDTQITVSVPANYCVQLSPTSGGLYAYFAGQNAGEKLVAKLIGCTATDGSTATVAAVFEQS